MEQQQQATTAKPPEARVKNSGFGFNLEDLDVSRESRGRFIDIEVRQREFELIQREAAMYASCSIVPDSFKGNMPNCAIALNMAHRIGVDALMVMQNLYIVHGRPSWSSQFLIAAFNSTGKFTPIKYKTVGVPDTNSYGYVAYVKTRDGEVVEGPSVTWGMVKGEGWDAKSGTKWKTIPELMFRYRAATFMIRTTSPEITMGFPTQDEVIDTTGAAVIDEIVAEADGIKEGTREDQQAVAAAKIATLQAEAAARAAQTVKVALGHSAHQELAGPDGVEADDIKEDTGVVVREAYREAIQPAAAKKMTFGAKR